MAGGIGRRISLPPAAGDEMFGVFGQARERQGLAGIEIHLRFDEAGIVERADAHAADARAARPGAEHLGAAVRAEFLGHGGAAIGGVEELFRRALGDLHVLFFEKRDGGKARAGRLAAFVAMAVRRPHRIAGDFIADRPAQAAAGMCRHGFLSP